MRVMDGLELPRRARQSQILTDLPVILCSGNDVAATMQEAWLRTVSRKTDPRKPFLGAVHGGVRSVVDTCPWLV
jgi:CheY-like chemotaxis protein